MAGTSKNPSSNSGKSNGAPGAALVYVKCGYTVCQFAHASGVTPPQPHVSHLATPTRVDELGQFLQSCRDVPNLDLLSGENSMDVEAAMVCYSPSQSPYL